MKRITVLTIILALVCISIAVFFTTRDTRPSAPRSSDLAHWRRQGTSAQEPYEMDRMVDLMVYYGRGYLDSEEKVALAAGIKNFVAGEMVGLSHSGVNIEGFNLHGNPNMLIPVGPNNKLCAVELLDRMKAELPLESRPSDDAILTLRRDAARNDLESWRVWYRGWWHTPENRLICATSRDDLGQVEANIIVFALQKGARLQDAGFTDAEVKLLEALSRRYF